MGKDVGVCNCKISSPDLDLDLHKRDLQERLMRTTMSWHPCMRVAGARDDSLLLAFVGRLSGWFFVRLVGCLVDWLVFASWLFVLLFRWLVGQCLDNCALALLSCARAGVDRVLLASDEDQGGSSFDIRHLLLLFLLSSHQAQLSEMFTLTWFWSGANGDIIIILIFIIVIIIRPS